MLETLAAGRTPHWGLALGIISLTFALAPVTAAAQSVHLNWNANPEPDVAGYIVHYGTAPGNYSQSVDAGNTNSKTLPLSIGETYYVAITAYDHFTLESALSAEISFTLSAPYFDWQNSQFSAADLADPAKEATVWGDFADPDGDKVVNLLEYAFAFDPADENATLIVQSSLQSDNGTDYPSITFRRALAAADLRYIVQVSEDLQTWREGSVYEGASATPHSTDTTQVSRSDDGIVETITVRANQAFVPGTQGCFLRVHVVRE